MAYSCAAPATGRPWSHDEYRHDPRSGVDTFARNFMVAAAFAGPAVMAVALMTSPLPTTTEGEAYVRAFAANLDAYAWSSWVFLAAFPLILAGLLAAARVARQGKPVLGLVGLVLAFLMMIPSASIDDTLYSALKSGVDVATATKMYSTPAPTAIVGELFPLALIGFLLIGVAALLGKTAPTWGAIALIVGPILVPIPWITGMSTVVAGAAWLVMAAGLGGVALGLLRRTGS
ncbi:hypothetical protein [Thermoactinospora rubra]|uniref:hypothetical protein n=1 Tax=Thermoactinospora rubra TaxID=1088767 RepID=UPI001180A71A|nr:hypothetical protein [Thermoactinospora rubra]